MAYEFNGSSQSLTAPLTFAGYPLTLSCRVSFNSLSTNPYLIAFDTPTLNNYRKIALSVLSSGVARAVVVNDVGDIFVQAASPTATIATNIPYTLTAVFTNSSSRSVYVDKAKYTNTDSLSISAPTRFIIGAVWAATINGLFLNGFLAEAAIWNAALTDAEVASLAAGFTPDQICPQSLQFYAPLVRDLIDVRGGRTITNNNGATVATHPRVIT